MDWKNTRTQRLETRTVRSREVERNIRWITCILPIWPIRVSAARIRAVSLSPISPPWQSVERRWLVAFLQNYFNPPRFRCLYSDYSLQSNKPNSDHFFIFIQNRQKQYSATMSAILSADDLNDFISPGVACIKPVETLPPKDTKNHEVCPLIGLIGTMWHSSFFY